jgi:hypothetical protein
MSFAQLLSQQAAILAEVLLESQDPDENGATMATAMSMTLSNAELSRGVVQHLWTSPTPDCNLLSAFDFVRAISQDFNLTTATITRMHEKLRNNSQDEARLQVPVARPKHFSLWGFRRQLFAEQKRFEKLAAATESGYLKYANAEDSLHRLAHLLGISAVFYAHFMILAPFEDGNELTAQFIVFALLAKCVAVPFHISQFCPWTDTNYMKAPLELCKEMLQSVRETSSAAAYLSLE